MTKEYSYINGLREFSAVVDNNSMVDLHVTTDFGGHSISVNLKEFSEIVEGLNKLRLELEEEINNKLWHKWELKDYLGKEYWMASEEDFEFACEEEGFEMVDEYTFKKIKQ